MKYCLKGLFFLICFFSSMSLSAEYASDSSAPIGQAKVYFNADDLEIVDNAIYIHLEGNLLETNIIRTDQYGLYIFENDITDYGIAKEKKWKCPYCHRWWSAGERCRNTECPTNQW